MVESNKPAILSEALVADFLKRDLPNAAEQADNFILWLGGKTFAGQEKQTRPHEDYALVGSHLRQGFLYLISGLKNEGLLVAEGKPEMARLSFRGWQRYEELRRGRSHSKKAFMAMKFGNLTLDAVYQGFQRAALQTGFVLAKNDEQPKAGIIDNNMRVEIQTSRFLIVDLTDNNLGAYWEAGFAEGLGKPVIYSCERSFFEKEKTHFDANHLYTVKWESHKLDEACKELKAAIRATFPDEAIMQDDI